MDKKSTTAKGKAGHLKGKLKVGEGQKANHVPAAKNKVPAKKKKSAESYMAGAGI
jgi:hypothetical protein